MEDTKFDYALALTRIFLGLVFLWAFFDKLLGLGFATSPEKSWLSGGSPTYGFLTNAVHGPLANFYHSLAPSTFVEYSFMIGLLVIGLGLTLGLATRFVSYSGIVLMILMYSALLPPENNPLIDEHIIYAFILLTIALSKNTLLGLQKRWNSLKLVKNFPFHLK